MSKETRLSIRVSIVAAVTTLVTIGAVVLAEGEKRGRDEQRLKATEEGLAEAKSDIKAGFDRIDARLLDMHGELRRLGGLMEKPQ